MPFLHVFCKKSHFLPDTTSYVVTCVPEIDDQLITTIDEIFHQFCDGKAASKATSQRLTVNCKNEKMPVNVAEKSLVVLVLLEKFENLGWTLVSGDSIHNQGGMIFKKVS